MLRGVMNTKKNWKIIHEKLDELKTGAVHWRLITHSASFVCRRTNSNLCYKLELVVELEMSVEDDQVVLTDHVVVCHRCDAAKMTALLR